MSASPRLPVLLQLPSADLPSAHAETTSTGHSSADFADNADINAHWFSRFAGAKPLPLHLM